MGLSLKRGSTMKNSSYEITIWKRRGVVDHVEKVSGKIVGEHLGVRKVKSSYQIDHIPTGLRIGDCKTQKLALAVARELIDISGVELYSDNVTKAVDAIPLKFSQWLSAGNDGGVFTPYDLG